MAEPSNGSTNGETISTKRDIQARDMELFSENVRNAASALNLNANSLGTRLGIPSSTASNYWKGARPWPTEVLGPLADELGTTIDQLLGRGEFGSAVTAEIRRAARRAEETGNVRAYLPVERLPSYAGAGGGGTGEGDIEHALVPRSLIEDELHARPADLLVIDVRGDSMEPIFQHGDQILIDRRDRNPAQPGPFALWDGDAYVVKLVERVPGKKGWYRIFSSNPRYTPYEVEEDEARFMGRPVWFGRRL